MKKRKSLSPKDFRFFVGVVMRVKWTLGTPTGAPKLGLPGGGWGDFSGWERNQGASITAFLDLVFNSKASAKTS